MIKKLRNRKTGISLIVLIITIIVVIILVSAVIISLSNSNIIKTATEAIFKANAKEYESEANLFVNNMYISSAGKSISELNYEGSSGDYSIISAISSIKQEDIEKFAIKSGEFMYIGYDEEEIEWCEEINIKIDNDYGNLLREAKLYDEQEHNSSRNNNSQGVSPVSGTFILPYTYINWNDNNWNDEITQWKKLGIEYVIMGDTIYKDGGLWKSYYPSSIASSMYYDALTPLFEKCSKAGIKVFIGMGMDANWWNLDLSKEIDGQRFIGYCNEIKPFIEEMYNKYYNIYNDTFYGFYFVPEMANPSYFDNTSARAIAVNSFSSGLNLLINTINSKNPDLKMLFSPYLNIKESDSWTCKSTDSIQTFWKELLVATNFRSGDILCPQDSIGSKGMNLRNLLKYTLAYKRAIKESNKDIKLWSNVELFDSPDSEAFQGKPDGVEYTGTATADRIIDQIEIVSPCVERIVLFTYSNYMSAINTTGGVVSTYLDYLKTGSLDSEKPKAPNKFKTEVVSISGKNCLQVSFSGMYDNYGIARINVYKNGAFYTYRVATRSDENKDLIPTAPNSFFDKNFNLSNDRATYQIEVIDSSGNISNRVSFTVEKGSVPNGVILDSAYKGPGVRIAPSGGSIYTDVNGNTAPVPKGFTVSTISNENVISKGLVIKDSSNNEFVWVPVSVSEYDNYYRDSNRVGIDSTLPQGIDSELMQILKYGGFYIGRYESAYDYNKGNPRVAVKKSEYASSTIGDLGVNPLHDKYLWNFVLSNEARSYSEEMASKYNYNSTVKTGLVTGRQWDTTLKWIGDEKINNATSWGNYKASLSPATSGNYESGVLKPSGSNENWKANNIYDIAGNLSEWTNEMQGSEFLTHDTSFNNVNAVLTFYWPNSVYRYENLGFRVALFID